MADRMTIYIDADSCPATRIAERIAMEHNGFGELVEKSEKKI